MRGRLISRVLLLEFVLAAAQAAGWPQWRGPSRNGLGDGGPPLADSWPADGPAKLWESEAVPSGGEGGYGSPVVADGRVYLYANERFRVPIAARKLSSGALRGLGWHPEKLPDDLGRAVEEARMSKERAELKGGEVGGWIDQWTNLRLDEEQKKRFGALVRRRIADGKDALPLGLLDELATIQDREFASQEELDKWFAEHRISDDLKKRVMAAIPTDKTVAKDAFLCLDASDGKTLWRAERPEARPGSASSTLCVAGDRVFGLTSRGEAVCLNAKTGETVWSAKCGGGHSSFLVVDGCLVVMADALTALDAGSGTVKWTQREVRSHENSPVCWRAGSTTYLICNTSRGVACVELTSGRVLWTVEGGGPSTAAVAEDHMAILTDKEQTGLIAYRLSVDKPQKLWSMPELTDRGASPLIYGGHVYAVASRKTVCVELATGKVAWEGQPGGGDICSPVIADGLLFAILRGGREIIMARAAPASYQLLGKAKASLSACASPAIADGKLYVRAKSCIECYDLRKPAAAGK